MSSIKVEPGKITIQDQGLLWTGVTVGAFLGLAMFILSITSFSSAIFDLGLIDMQGAALCLFPMSILLLLGSGQTTFRYLRQGRKLLFFEATAEGFSTCANGDMRIKKDYQWSDLRGVILTEDFATVDENGRLAVNLIKQPAVCLTFKDDIGMSEGFFEKQKRQFEYTFNGLPVKIYSLAQEDLASMQNSFEELSNGSIEIKAVKKLTAQESDPNHFTSGY